MARKAIHPSHKPSQPARESVHNIRERDNDFILTSTRVRGRPSGDPHSRWRHRRMRGRNVGCQHGQARHHDRGNRLDRGSANVAGCPAGRAYLDRAVRKHGQVSAVPKSSPPVLPRPLPSHCRGAGRPLLQSGQRVRVPTLPRAARRPCCSGADAGLSSGRWSPGSPAPAASPLPWTTTATAFAVSSYSTCPPVKKRPLKPNTLSTPPSWATFCPMANVEYVTGFESQRDTNEPNRSAGRP